jgi:hypothetical protein
VRGHVLKINFLNSNTHPEIIGEDKLSSYSNYFLGRDSCKWRSFVGHYQTVRMKDVWPGIDVVQKIQTDGVETVYRVQAGANAQQINVQIEGLTAPLRTDGQGNLILSTSLGEIKERVPFAYQNINHRQMEVPVRFQVLANNQYSLSFEAFDASKELVIDPLVYSTFLGGSGFNTLNDITQNEQGDKIVCGYTTSDDFPTTPGAYQANALVRGCATISAFASDGRSLLFSTYLGGITGLPTAKKVLCDRQSAIYVFGDLVSTQRTNFPLTTNAFDTVAGGDYEVFFSRLNSSGSVLDLSSYIGGSNAEFAGEILQDSSGFIYLIGWTDSPDFFTTSNALYPIYNRNTGPFISIYDPYTNSLVYSTYFPGTAGNELGADLVSPMRIWLFGDTQRDFPVPATADAYQSQFEGTNYENNSFFALLDLTERRIVYLTYWAGHGRTYVRSLVQTNSNEIILAGSTSSPDFPVTSGAYDTVHVGGFITRFQYPSTILESTFFAGGIRRVIQDDRGAIIISGAGGAGVPTTPDAYDSTLNGGHDAFICRLSHNMSDLEYGTLIGGNEPDELYAMVSDSINSFWLVGDTYSLDFPTTPDAFQRFSPSGGIMDGYVVHFDLPPAEYSSNRDLYIPSDLRFAAYPNPFNPTTTLAFTLPISSPTQVVVYDLLGRIVLLRDLGRMNAGAHHTLLDVPGLPSGTYIVRMNAGKEQLNKKVVLLK